MYTLYELKQLKTISTGHTDNLKIDDRNIRVWLSRMTIEDGMDYNNQVTVECLIDGCWVTQVQYEAI